MKPARAELEVKGRRPDRGLCSVCRLSRPLNERGLVKLHRRHGQVCDGTALPPAERKPRVRKATWHAARAATLERDGHRCQKCDARDDLEVHHKKERVYGGTDELDNLITLCGHCHAEWTFCEPEPMPFDVWLGIPPARYLVAVFAMPWPSDKSALEYKREIERAVRLSREAYEAGRSR